MAKGPPSPLKVATSARLRAVQAELDLTDEAMGDLVGRSRSAWSNWKSERLVEMADLEAMIRLCERTPFGLTLDWIFRGIDDQLPRAAAARLAARLEAMPSRQRGQPKDSDDRVLFAERIVWARQEIEQDPAETARAMGVPLPIWRDIESGRTRPGDDVLDRFCEYAGVSLDYLLRGVLRGVHPEMAAVLASKHSRLLLPPEARVTLPMSGAATDSSAQGAAKRTKAGSAGRGSRRVAPALEPAGDRRGTRRK